MQKIGICVDIDVYPFIFTHMQNKIYAEFYLHIYAEIGNRNAHTANILRIFPRIFPRKIGVNGMYMYILII